MADPKEVENKAQATQPELGKDALQEEREKAEKDREKAYDRDIRERNAKGEVVISNPFVEGWLRAIGKFKEFFDTLFNKDTKANEAENQGSGHYIHESLENNAEEVNPIDFYKTNPPVITPEQLARMALQGNKDALNALNQRIGQDEAQKLMNQVKESPDFKSSKEATKENDGQVL